MKWYCAVRSARFVIIITLFFSGCAGLIPGRHPLPEVKPEILKHNIQNHVNKLHSLQARAQITAASREGAFSGTLTMTAKPPDSLYMKIEGPLGIDLGSTLFFGDSVLIYSAWDNLLFKGKTGVLGINIVLPIASNPPDFLSRIPGLLLPVINLHFPLESYTIDGRHYKYQYINGETFFVSPKGPVVDRWEKRDMFNELTWSWEGDKYRKTGGIHLPYLIRLTEHQVKQRLTIYFKSIKVNRTLKTGWCDFEIPEGVETIEF